MGGPPATWLSFVVIHLVAPILPLRCATRDSHAKRVPGPLGLRRKEGTFPGFLFTALKGRSSTEPAVGAGAEAPEFLEAWTARLKPGP
jgi:hypothetical protein